MSNYTYTTKGTCAKTILAEIDDKTGIIKSLTFIGGCQGNLQELSKMLVGKTKEDVITLFKGNTCGKKDTSCMDQLATMLEDI